VPAAEALGAYGSLVPGFALAVSVAAVGAGSALGRMAALAIALLVLVAQLWATGIAAEHLLVGRPTAARVTLGAGFWLFVVSATAISTEIARGIGRPATVATVAILLAALMVGAGTGWFDALSLAVEYRARADLVHAAIIRHLVLATAALAISVSIAIPLAWLAFRSRRAETAIDGVLNAIQVIPVIALYGLLVPLLSLLLAAVPALRSAGLQAIGPTPAVIGVAAYLLLPLARALVESLRVADPAAVDAARAMGMSEARIAWEIRIPLGLSLVIAGFRTAVVQSIGLTTLAGLIGAGGLGGIVFEGMAQFASDLILLGAVPIVALALLADGLLRAFETSAAKMSQ
jgi:osmoprotectant transport system permease protein